jgi:cytoskeletal protein RodZ
VGLAGVPDDNFLEARLSIGETLAAARQQAGLTVTQVSQQTRIRETIIRAIEQDDFSSCGGDFYARGHIRSIASVVGTDPVPLIREYDQEHGPPGGIRAAEIFEPATPIKIREPRPFGLGKVLIVVLLAVIGFAIYHLVSTGSGSHPSAAASGTVRPTASPKASGTVNPVVHHPTPPVAVIKLTATQDCWIGLNSTSGKQLFQGTILAGRSMTWREKSAVSMVIGNPPGIVLTVNGRAETMSAVYPLTLIINPKSKTPVTTG